MPPSLTDSHQASDAAFAARLACGDADPLYRRHKAPIYRFALLWSGTAAVAADVTQDVFVHLLTRAEDFDPSRGPLQPWLLGITRNFVRRRTGMQAREEAHEPDELALPPAAIDTATPDGIVGARSAVLRLHATITALPPHYRDVLVLVELNERSDAEAAAICGCGLNTVRSRLNRARGLLARALDIDHEAGAAAANGAKG